MHELCLWIYYKLHSFLLLARVEAASCRLGHSTRTRTRMRAYTCMPPQQCSYVFYFDRSLPTGDAGLRRGQAPRKVQNCPPREGGKGLIPVANRRGAVDAKIDVGRNKELRLLTPASRRWVRRLNNPFCALPVPLQLCCVCPSKEPFASRHPRMPC